MNTHEDEDRRADRLAKIFRSGPPIRVIDNLSLSPPELLALAANVGKRLTSQGGRPTDPAWTMKRPIPFKPDTWRALERIAAAVSSTGRTVTAGQVAAHVIEDPVADLDRLISSMSRTT